MPFPIPSLQLPTAYDSATQQAFVAANLSSSQLYVLTGTVPQNFIYNPTNPAGRFLIQNTALLISDPQALAALQAQFPGLVFSASKLQLAIAVQSAIAMANAATFAAGATAALALQSSMIASWLTTPY